jgi:hypothetical protein
VREGKCQVLLLHEEDLPQQSCRSDCRITQGGNEDRGRDKDEVMSLTYDVFPLHFSKDHHDSKDFHMDNLIQSIFHTKRGNEWPLDWQW